MAYLKNNYKLMYEHREFEETFLKYLKATKGIPASSDLPVVYKRQSDGQTVNPKDFKFITEKNHLLFGSISGKPSEATIEFSVYCGTELVFGREAVIPVGQVEVTVTKDPLRENFDVCFGFEGSDPKTEIDRKIVNKGTQVRVYLETQYFAKWAEDPTTCLVNGVAKNLNLDTSKSWYYIVVKPQEDTVIIFNTGRTEDQPV